MNDAELTVKAIAELQEKNKQLEDSLKELGEAFKSLGSINQMLEIENKQFKNKLNKIEQIINSEVDPNICNNVGDVRKVQAIKQIVNNYDGSMLSMIKQFSEIQEVLEQE